MLVPAYYSFPSSSEIASGRSGRLWGGKGRVEGGEVGGGGEVEEEG